VNGDATKLILAYLRRAFPRVRGLASEGVGNEPSGNQKSVHGIFLPLVIWFTG
jgi:hypothetical protein